MFSPFNVLSVSKCEKLLGIKIDSRLNFKELIESLCKKTSEKIMLCLGLHHLWSLSREDFNNEFFCNFHFSFCLVVWMFYSRKLNARINRRHERALRVVYKDFDLPFQELLRKGSSTTLHQQNLQKLIYLIIWGVSLNVAVVYHVLKLRGLKWHLL